MCSWLCVPLPSLGLPGLLQEVLIVKCDKLLQLCLALCDPVGCSPSVSRPWDSQEYWEWVAISYSRESSQSRDQTSVSWVSCIGRRVLSH